MADSDFEYFTAEYAQALEAFKNLKDKAGTILLMGGKEELSGFLEQFMNMAAGRAREASETNLENFEEWFEELADLARELRRSLTAAHSPKLFDTDDQAPN